MPKDTNGVRLLQPVEVAARIYELETVLAPAFENCKDEIQALDALVMATEGKMWVFIGEVNSTINAAMIVEYCDYPRRRVLNVVGWAGPSRQFYGYLETLQIWAKANGAKEIRGYGKEGPARHARKFGFEEIYRVYRKEL